VRIGMSAITSCLLTGCPVGQGCQDDGTGTGNLICAPIVATSGSGMTQPVTGTNLSTDSSLLTTGNPLESLPQTSLPLTLSVNGIPVPPAPPLGPAGTPCPSGYTCSIWAGVPDLWIYMGIGALALITILSASSGRRRR